MSDFILFWLAKYLLELVMVALIIVAIIVAYFITQLPSILRQYFCRHDGPVRETMACDAICARCGKNLGFIGAWIERRKGKFPQHTTRRHSWDSMQRERE